MIDLTGTLLSVDVCPEDLGGQELTLRERPLPEPYVPQSLDADEVQAMVLRLRAGRAEVSNGTR